MTLKLWPGLPWESTSEMKYAFLNLRFQWICLVSFDHRWLMGFQWPEILFRVIENAFSSLEWKGPIKYKVKFTFHLLILQLEVKDSISFFLPCFSKIWKTEYIYGFIACKKAASFQTQRPIKFPRDKMLNILPYHTKSATCKNQNIIQIFYSKIQFYLQWFTS